MLPSSQRLSVGQFNSVMEKGRAYHSSLFLMRVGQSDGKPRVSSVIPVKVAKKASMRNKYRRLIYDAVGPVFFRIKAEYHIVIFAKNTILKSTPDQLSKEILEIFVKAGLLM